MVAAVVVRLAHAHAVVSEVHIAVVAEELGHRGVVNVGLVVCGGARLKAGVGRVASLSSKNLKVGEPWKETPTFLAVSTPFHSMKSCCR